jgi:hypothetical protein
MAKFWSEAAKVVKPGGTVALWTCGKYIILNIGGVSSHAFQHLLLPVSKTFTMASFNVLISRRSINSEL